LKQADDLKPVFDQVYTKVVPVPADALQPPIPAAQIFTQQLVQVAASMSPQGDAVSFVANGIHFLTPQSSCQSNALLVPAASQPLPLNYPFAVASTASPQLPPSPISYHSVYPAFYPNRYTSPLARLSFV
ncbi:DUF3053 family protein, partial [Salmonella enterica]|uniref:DUF3053 family protein n=1 Tax=Salmonella enterica TaxID=28901 RepID=UPI00398C777B